MSVMVGGWLLLLALLCATVWAQFDSTLDQHWDLWKKTYQKSYKNQAEELGRRALWEKNLKQINIHNLEASMGLHTYTMAVNHMSDLNHFKIVWSYSSLTLDIPSILIIQNSTDQLDMIFQGSCGSCWAFSTAGALEGLLAKTTGKLVDLSPQNLVDCSGKYGTQGCNGGRPHYALQYVIDNQGIDSEASYRYKGKDRTCRYRPAYRAANCSEYYFVDRDELSLKQAVATIGPIIISLNADDISYYKSGVYYNPSCGKRTNHAVLLVGYGTDHTSGLDYWLIKNSWGKRWGERGYIRMARNKDQMCGISMYAVYPL
uniref:Cathepsin S, ortholog 1 n=1 Tax=Periophthalmus magnuspinnatus TaxID=409849 RepID=A0A3B3Z884_9GOBI